MLQRWRENAQGSTEHKFDVFAAWGSANPSKSVIAIYNKCLLLTETFTTKSTVIQLPSKKLCFLIWIYFFAEKFLNFNVKFGFWRFSLISNYIFLSKILQRFIIFSKRSAWEDNQKSANKLKSFENFRPNIQSLATIFVTKDS